MQTIYIVEDDVNIREIERYALKNSGYEVEEFESGEAFFKRLKLLSKLDFLRKA